MFQEAGDPALQQGFRGTVDSPASPRQLVGPLDELLQALLGIMRGEQPPRGAELDLGPLAAPDQRLAAGPGFRDDLPDDIIEPGELSRLGRSGAAENNQGDQSTSSRQARHRPWQPAGDTG